MRPQGVFEATCSSGIFRAVVWKLDPAKIGKPLFTAEITTTRVNLTPGWSNGRGLWSTEPYLCRLSYNFAMPYRCAMAVANRRRGYII
jgi:hypothetical protein